jgi:hypothetical protein
MTSNETREAHMRQMINEHKSLVDVSEREKPLGKFWRGWADNIEVHTEFHMRMWIAFKWLRKGSNCKFLWIQ